MRKTIALTGLLSAAFFVAPALATPEPSPVPTAWELSLQPTEPMRIQVDTGAGPQLYWYFLYTVTNSSGQDVDFHPEIVRVSEIDTDDPTPKIGSQQGPRIIVDPAIVGINTRVYKAIAQRHSKTHPFLVSPIKAIDRLLQGKDNARTSVAIFQDLDPRAQKFTIYFGGLSGEHDSKPNPQFNAKKPEGANNPRFFVIRKTLAMPFTLPGDARTRRGATPVLGRMTWVMR
jgi:hypothetical protein